ncbi:MAG: ABC transporter ATP-binding protein [Acidobacteria bacterium]|nr:ABC transporter ATP-binding protein [Acidobacteriota bacterium]
MNYQPLAIKTEGLTKVFRAGTNILELLGRRSEARRCTVALDDIDLGVKQGEIFALLGPNGAGKTTLIKILCSLILPDAGDVRVMGFDVVREQDKIKTLISLVVGEERSFYWRLTGRQNLEFFASLYNLTAAETRDRIERAASLLELTDLDKRYQEYSTGAKQRLAVARSFLNGAKLIFMDEPTRSLDLNAAAKLRDLIRNRLGDSGCTFFFTTHHTQEAEVLADRIAVLDQGKIKACGTLRELRDWVGNLRVSLEEIFQKLTQSRGILHDGGRTFNFGTSR